MSGPWRVLAASVAGGAHVRAGRSCQDAYAVRRLDGALIVAVADGAGGAPLSAAGAALAVELACERLAAAWQRGPRDGLHPLDDGPAATASRRALVDVASDAVLRRFRRAAAGLARASRGLRPGDFGTTLTAVLVDPPWLALFAVGDGFVVTRAGADRYDLPLAPPGGPDHPLGATTLLTSPGARDRAQRAVIRIPDLAGVAVGTDGMQTLLLEYAGARPVRPYAAKFDELFGHAADPDTDPMHLTRVLAGPRVNQRTDDDRTLVLAVPG